MKIAIIGLGLIGASMAKALRGSATITGIDADGRTVRQALDDGVIASGSTDMAAAAHSDAVVIAVPVCSIVDAAAEVIRHIGTDTVLTDTGSTKAHIVERIEAMSPCFVGSHPIAGKENPGYAHSQEDLFRGAMTIITPTGRSRRDCVERVTSLWETCGTRIQSMDPLTHDRLMAVISHMPHLLSYASMKLADELHIHRQLLGAGFRDFTRIAASDPIMWRDIFSDNREHILPLIDTYVQELLHLRTLIEQDRTKDLEAALSSYAQIRRTLYGHPR
ncbi:MAG TPA: prephenate dehydrogenase [Deltaproteobacteria bacterium]|nr:prephenate dehydrogenase [Deltaproteobacteria bacterium]